MFMVSNGNSLPQQLIVLYHKEQTKEPSRQGGQIHAHNHLKSTKFSAIPCATSRISSSPVDKCVSS
eukprot:c16798_g1_i1 orf=243-440(-)